MATFSALKETSRNVTLIHRALVTRDDCEYNPILLPGALRLLQGKEEELRYNVQFGFEDRLPDIAGSLVPIFRSAWTREKKLPVPGEVRDDPDLLRTIVRACKELTKIGNAGYFRDPAHSLVLVLNPFIDYIAEREQLISRCMGLQLKPLQP